MPSVRTFIAVELADPVRRRAAQLTEQLAQTNVKVTWVAPQNMHLTLVFLGDVPQEKTAAVCRPWRKRCGRSRRSTPNAPPPERFPLLAVRAQFGSASAKAASSSAGCTRRSRTRWHGWAFRGKAASSALI